MEPFRAMRALDQKLVGIDRLIVDAILVEFL